MKIAKYVVMVSYRKYEFEQGDDAVSFALTAAHAAIEPVDISIHIITEDENVDL